MLFFKELWILIKLLISTRPEDFDSLELLEMKYFPFSGYKYITWCGKMIYRSSIKDRILADLESDRFKLDESHEMIHLCQAKVKGSWIKYYLSYFLEWLKGAPMISPCESAYYTIPYEMEAYANEGDSEYIRDYTKVRLNKYIIKNRKRTYIENWLSWKEYIKAL